MNKYVAIALLASIVYAKKCDPFVEDCQPKDAWPVNFKAAYWMHGITSYMQSIYMGIVLGVYANSLGLLGSIYTTVSYTIAAINFLLYMPVAVVWTLTVVWESDRIARMYDRWLIASNIYGWLLTATNTTWYMVLVLMILIFFVFDSNVVKPDIWLPIAGLSVEWILQVMYSIGYAKSRKLMNCWGWEFPEGRECTWEKRTKDLDDLDSDGDGALITITIG
jgi:hypothetical protein